VDDEAIDPFADLGWTELPEFRDGFEFIVRDARRRVASRNARFHSADSTIEEMMAAWEEFREFNIDRPPGPFNKVVQLGAKAIPALHACIENDRRSTRFYHNDDHSFYESQILTVADFAILALERVLEFPVLQPEFASRRGAPPDAWYAQQAALLSAFCEKYENASGAELWFRILGDEGVSLEHRWIAALSIIGAQVDSPTVPGYWFHRRSYGFAYEGYAGVSYLERGDPPAGEVLRTRQDPSVTDLLVRAWRAARAAAELAEKSDYFQQNRIPLTGVMHEILASPSGGAHQFILAIEEWDPGSRPGVLREHSEWLAAGLMQALNRDPASRPWTAMRRGYYCEEALTLRFKYNDPAAMADYRKLFSAYLSASVELWFLPLEPMKRFPRAEGMADLARAAFRSPGAPFAFDRPWAYNDPRKQVIHSCGSLLAMAPFRESLIEALRVEKNEGTITITDEGYAVKFDDEDGDPESEWEPARERSRFPAGTTRQVRTCDLVAGYLMRIYAWSDPVPLKSKPPFDIGAPQTERDAAIREWISALSALHDNP
jgi:hypothetical protein